MTQHSSLGSKDSANLSAIIEDLRHYIPEQGPMEEFVHHNTLHAFQHFSFFDGVMAASRKFGSYFLAPRNYYVESLRKAEFNRELWMWVAKRRGCLDNFQTAQSRLSEPNLDQTRFSPQNLRHSRNDLIGFREEERLIRFMIRISGSFLDQGVALSSMPSKNTGLWKSLRHIERNSFFSLFPSSRKVTLSFLNLSSEQACEKLLDLIVGDPKLFHDYLLEVLLCLPGWAGMTSTVEKAPHLMRKSFNPRLMDWIATFLLFEYGLLKKSTGRKAFPRLTEVLNLGKGLIRSTPEYSPSIAAVHEYLEWSEYLKYIRIFRQPTPDSLDKKRAKAQFIFCIDDRELSLRRYIKEEDEDVATFGAPGFFGIDFFTVNRSRSKSRLFKMAPVPAAPKNIVYTSYKNPAIASAMTNWSLNKSIISSWLESLVLGVPKAAKLIFGIFFPTFQHPRRAEEESRLFPETVVQIPAGSNPNLPISKDASGFSVAEATTKLESFLKLVGLTDNFSKVVCIVGHGASSVNNPYFSAYDCGACSGKSGSLNSYVFCTIANTSEVRKNLGDRGILIPSETIFVPFIHDTTCDVIEQVPSKDATSFSTDQKQILDSCKESIHKALKKNALWRCRQFKVHGKIVTSSKAVSHVRNRAAAWFEPRPEYNHATNIGCYIGKREVWRDLPKERTMFLQSYSPESDPNGSILAGALNAVIPVCGGINLEYFFSALDPEVYGASSKLAQNVSGMVGVVTGLESDLRTGLPRQMTEIHEPYRLLILIDQNPQVVASALGLLKHHATWVDNNWVWIVSRELQSEKVYVHSMTEYSEFDF